MTELALAALAHWGLGACEPELLKFRENAVFRVVAAERSPVVLRVHRRGYHSDASLRSEHEWMEYLDRSGIKVPSVIRAGNGASFVHVGLPGQSTTWQVDLLSWLDGDPIGCSGVALAMPPSELTRVFEALGRTIARMHDATMRWVPRPGFDRHSWDLEGLLGPRPLWGSFRKAPYLDMAACQRLDEAHRAAMVELSAYEKSTRNFGMIHADLVRENILLGDDIRVLDFDDAGFGWHMYDIAVALYQNRNEPDYPMIERALLAGYRRERGLTEADVATLPLFTLTRALALLGWIATRTDSDVARQHGPQLVKRALAAADSYLARGGVPIRA